MTQRRPLQNNLSYPPSPPPDRIVVIRQGKIVEEGRHEDLLAANGMYAQLVFRQLRGGAEAAE